jgi:sigma-E factor negative regulatory protein RseB
MCDWSAVKGTLKAGTDRLRRLAGLLLLAGAPVVGAETARQWLDEMSSALQTLDYDGTFVYLHDGRLEAMRIFHQVDAGGERERLVSLTGSAREVLRDDKVVTCIMPDNKSVMVGQSRPRQPFPVIPRDLGSVSHHYLLEDLGDDRMAGRMTRVIAITPKDDYRYGYRFWIDKNTRMLLKSDLTTADSEPIEQVMFTRLGIGAEISDAELEPSLTGEGYSWRRQENVRPDPVVDPGHPGWRVASLPEGFELTHFQHKRMRQGDAAAEHMVYSDGLASVSVYVEQLSVPGDGFSGLSTMGAVNAYGLLLDGNQVTVVGEVPPVTVEMIAHSVVRQPQDDRHD